MLFYLTFFPFQKFWNSLFLNLNSNIESILNIKMEVNCKVLQCKIITHEDIFKVCYYNSPYIFKTLLRLYDSSIL